jgi:hypothetical protein
VSVSHPEGRVGDGSRDHRTPSQPPTKGDGVNGFERMVQRQVVHLPKNPKEEEGWRELRRKIVGFK